MQSQCVTALEIHLLLAVHSLLRRACGGVVGLVGQSTLPAAAPVLKFCVSTMSGSMPGAGAGSGARGGTAGSCPRNGMLDMLAGCQLAGCKAQMSHDAVGITQCDRCHRSAASRPLRRLALIDERCSFRHTRSLLRLFL